MQRDAAMVAVVSVIAICCASSGSTAQPMRPPAKAPSQSSCLAELMKGQGANIACEYPVWMTDAERAELRSWTRDMVLDARCVVSVRIARALVDGALGRADAVFLAPPQPVTCTVTTAKSPLTISGTFAPRVVFKGGLAVEASPGLGNVQGVPAAVAWPVIGFVNSSSLIGKGLVEAVNAYLTRQRADASSISVGGTTSVCNGCG